MNSDDFEKRLQSQPMRQIPGDWREQILQGARQSDPSTLDPSARRSNARAARLSFLSTLLWPSPKAWAGLAAVWVAIFALQFWSRGHSKMVATATAPQSSHFWNRLKDEQQTLVELMGNDQPSEVDQSRNRSPKPRSELRHRELIV
jgi:hypothetical protein